MWEKFNDLQTLIMRETKSVNYIHSFAHQLQLAFVFISKNYYVINHFIDLVACLLNVIRASFNHWDKLKEQHVNKAIESLMLSCKLVEVLKKEMSFKRPSDTHQGSHYASHFNIMVMFSSVIDVLEDIEKNDTYQDQNTDAQCILELLESFDFLFFAYI